jgi:CHAT domain-containing protein/tetratricopeptide (TPR) repeat protein
MHRQFSLLAPHASHRPSPVTPTALTAVRRQFDFDMEENLGMSTILRRNSMKAARKFIGLLFLFVISVIQVVGQDSKVPILRDGLVVVGDLDGGEHFLAVELKQEQTLHLDIQEKRVNVSVALIKLAEKKLIKLLNFGSGYDRETLTYIAEQTGTYIIAVATRTPPSKGRYVLSPRIKETTRADRERLRAEQLLDQGLSKSKGNSSDLSESIAKLKESLLLWRKLGETYWEGYTLYNLGRVHEGLKKEAEALDYYEQALPRIRRAQDIHGEAVTLNSIGLIYSNLGDRDRALDYYSQTLILVKQVGNLEAVATGLHNLGAVHSDLGDNTKALAYYHQALDHFKQLNDPLGTANSLLGLGEVFFDLDAHTKAIDHFSEAAKVFKDVGELRGAGTALHNIGDAYYRLDDATLSLNHYNQALKIFMSLPNKRDISNTLKAMGLVYSAMGEKATAFSYFHEALALLSDVGDPRIEGSILKVIGMFYIQLGERVEALKYFKEALPRFRQVKEHKQEGETLTMMGLACMGLRRHKEAIDYFTEALVLFKNLKDKKQEANILLSIGAVYSNGETKDKGASFIKEALAILEELIRNSNSSVDFNNIAFIHFERGEKSKAFDYLYHSLANSKYESLGNNDYFPLGTLSQWLGSLGKRRLAIFYRKLSVNKYQDKRTDLQGIDSEFQRSFLRDDRGGYEHLASLLIEEGRIQEAVQALNLYQDQKLMDFNHDKNLSSKRIELSRREQAIATRYEAAGERIRIIGSKITLLKQQNLDSQGNQHEPPELPVLEADLKNATAEFLKVIRDAETEFAKPPDGTDQVAVPDVVEMQSALRELNVVTGQKTATLYTLIGKDNFYLILILPNGAVKSFKTRIEEDVLVRKLTEFHALLQSPTYDPRPLGSELYRIIFKPVETALKESGVQTLMWQLDGNLRYVPMAALFDGEKYLVERYQNVVFTRSDTTQMLRSVKPSWTGTGFGGSQEQTVDLLGDQNKIHLPALAGVIEELRSIFGPSAGSSAPLSGRVLTDRQFTKNAFYETMKQRHSLVHIASHFSFRPGDDSRSFLLMGDGTVLTLNEMKRKDKLFDGVELLTLSACNTAATQADANGKEIDGFAELAQRLGVASVMATLWQVSDYSTPWLMKEFYTMRQRKRGTTKAEALKNAQLALLNGTADAQPLSAQTAKSNAHVKVVVLPDASKQERDLTRAEIVYLSEKDAPLFIHSKKNPYAHPYYWSPFVLFGNWR